MGQGNGVRGGLRTVVAWQTVKHPEQGTSSDCMARGCVGRGLRSNLRRRRRRGQWG